MPLNLIFEDEPSKMPLVQKITICRFRSSRWARQQLGSC